MRSVFAVFALSLLLLAGSLAPGTAHAQRTAPTNQYMMIDQFGYRPDDPKVAVLVSPERGFNAADAYDAEAGDAIEVREWYTGAVVFSGEPARWNSSRRVHATQSSSGDRGWWVDFSEITTPGSYYLYDPANDVRSYRFEIREDVYRGVFEAAIRTFYYQRANTPKEPPFADERWSDGADFVGANQDAEAIYFDPSGSPQTNRNRRRDVTGGWRDAGDTNKYVTFAEPVVHMLLTAFEQRPEVFTDDFNIPESGNGLPDIIDEIKWETDWIKKMQDDDGGVFIKMGNNEHGPTSHTLSLARNTRYYGPKCSSATIAAAGMFAHAAVVYRDFPELAAEANDLTARAIEAWDWFFANPVRSNSSNECDNNFIKAGDADRSENDQLRSAVVTALYLYEATGDEAYHDYFKDNFRNSRPYEDDMWSVYVPFQGDALLYYTQMASGDAAIQAEILGKKQDEGRSVDIYAFRASQDLYRAYMRERQYHWGSNYVRAAMGNTVYDLVDFGLSDDADLHRARALGMLHYFHGVNPLSLVYLSNMYEYGAENAVNEMWHDWYADGTKWDHALNSPSGPAPGFLVGGPNRQYTGTVSRLQNQPYQKMYTDINHWTEAPWEITEPAIYYQAAYIKLLSKFVSTTGGINVSNELKPQLDLPEGFRLEAAYPNPFNPSTTFRLTVAEAQPVAIEVFNLLGQRVRTLHDGLLSAGTAHAFTFDASDLPSGLYLYRAAGQTFTATNTVMLLK
ncbi:MAG: glycoside hydrolase family 9 protein [Bacteroidota bacterium]